MDPDCEKEIERLDRRIDKLRRRIENGSHGKATSDPSALRLVGAIATLLTALAAFLTPILVVVLQ